MKIIDMRSDTQGQSLTDFTNLQFSEASSAKLLKPASKLDDQQPFSKLFSKVFKLKEKLKHELATAVNQQEYNENMRLTVEYEQETVKARLESQREEATVTADFRREVETKILNRIGATP